MLAVTGCRVQLKISQGERFLCRAPSTSSRGLQPNLSSAERSLGPFILRPFLFGGEVEGRGLVLVPHACCVRYALVNIFQRPIQLSAGCILWTEWRESSEKIGKFGA